MLLDIPYNIVSPLIIFVAALLLYIAKLAPRKVYCWVNFIVALLAVLGGNFPLLLLSLALLILELITKEDIQRIEVFHLLVMIFWSAIFFNAISPLGQLLSLSGFLVNIFFVRIFFKEKKVQLELNLFYFVIISSVLLLLFMLQFGEAMLSGGFSNKNIGSLFFVFVLLAYYYVSLHVVPATQSRHINYIFRLLMVFSLALFHLTKTYDLFELAAFEEPYRSRLIQWLYFIFLNILPIYHWFRGSKYAKLFSLLHYAMFIPILFPILSREIHAEHLVLMVLASFLSIILLTTFSRRQKTLLDMLVFVAMIMIAISPFSHTLAKCLQDLMARPDFWHVSREILYFPICLLLIPIAFMGYNAFVVCNDCFYIKKPEHISLAMLKKPHVVLALLFFVLGIYPFPLYIYIQFILEK